MAPADNTATAAEANLKVLLLALKNAVDLKVNYHDLASDLGITSTTSANIAQKKFKAIVEKSGDLKLVNGKVVPANAGSATTTAPADKGDEDNDDDEPTTPSKKRKTATPTAKRSRKGRPLAQALPEADLPSSE